MNKLTLPPALLRRLRALCLALPGAVEKEAWGDPTWRVRDRIFAAAEKGNDSGGRPSLWVKAPPGEAAFMVEASPGRFFIPPYVGHKGWVGIHLDGALDWGELRRIVETSFGLIAGTRRAAASGGRVLARTAARTASPGRPRAPR